MASLGLNIDHIATIRQARGGNEPDPIAAALIGELAGARGITAHLREDRRHIQDRDIRLLKQVVTTHLNLEMACTAEMVAIALEIVPNGDARSRKSRGEDDRGRTCRARTRGGLGAVHREAAEARHPGQYVYRP